METFVIRIWTPGGEEAALAANGDLHGLVEHVGSGKRVSFERADQLLGLLREGVDGAVRRRACFTEAGETARR
jgi:hypothetical protein